ncbi:response regulator [uncultured Kordia sp.]|uniref:response regulator n=1 Tax=uncultured Kordia sp. TaxID=507699 RepID=UPI002623D79A|nr:response regulator [uncultured Kordia sp.]
MFKKILVVEDIEIANYGIIKILVDKKIILKTGIIHTQYCDKAFVMFKEAMQKKDPFDLVITDLSFERNYWNEDIASGLELIKKIRNIQSSIKVIVYSIENKISKINSLFSDQKINGFVAKDGYDAKELVNAVREVYTGKIYKPTQLQNILDQKKAMELTDYQKILIEKLLEGLSQREVQQYFKKHNITPNSISIIEKRIEKLKIDFNANNTLHLIAILKDFGLI